MEVLNIVLPVFSIIALGFILKEKKFLTESDIKTLNKVTFYIALPLLIAYDVATADFSEVFHLRLIIGLYLAIGAMFLFSYVIGGVLGLDNRRRSAVMMTSFRGNLAYVGFPIIVNAFGEDALAQTAVVVSFLVPYMLFLVIASVALCNGADDKVKNGKGVLRSTLQNPLVISSIIGLSLSAIGFQIPYMVDKMVKPLTQMALPIALLGIGGSVDTTKLRGDLKLTGLIGTLKLIVLVLFGMGILYFMGVTGFPRKMGLVLLAMPPAVSTYIVASGMDSDSDLVASGLVVSTIASIFTISIWLMVLGVV